MQKASFCIRPRHGEWVVEDDSREIGGIFTTLVAAVEFAAREAHRFRGMRMVIETSEPPASADTAA